MKKLFLSLGLLPFLAGAQTPCESGFADIYPCDNVDLWRFMDMNAIGGATNVNDIWGWTDPVSGREFALVGKSNGTAFVDVSVPGVPIYLGTLPTHTTNSLWRDIKVHGNYAYIVSEAGGHGMQVFDLTQLPLVENPPVAFTESAHYAGFGNAHNVVINEETNFAVGVGSNTASGGLHFVDISNPLEPVFAGDFAEDGYTHDAQIVIYSGPDQDHCGREIAFCSNENTVTIVDVTDKTDAFAIAIKPYSNSAYTHQCWLSEDQQYLYVNDELDEMNGLTEQTRTLIWDVRDLDNPLLIMEHQGVSTSIDHNLYVRSNLLFQSNYRSGLRILDGSKVSEGNLHEVGFFDVYPTDDNALFSGTWSNYCYFASGSVVVTDMYTGLFILRPRVADADYLIEVQDDQDVAAASVYINHAAENIELLINDLPVGVSAIIGALQAPGETAITLEGLEQLAPGDYPFSYSLSYDQELRIFDGLIRVNNVVAPFIAQLAPTTGAVLPEQTVTLEWSDNFNASDYHVIVAFETEDLSNVIFETDLTENSVTIPFDLPNGIYYWTVSGSGLCDTSGESTTGSFSVNWVSVDELAAEKFYAFPNPTQGQLTIVNSGDQLSWNLSDELGRVVLSGSLAAKTSGTIDMRGLANGVYILSDMNGKRTRVVKQ